MYVHQVGVGRARIMISGKSVEYVCLYAIKTHVSMDVAAHILGEIPVYASAAIKEYQLDKPHYHRMLELQGTSTDHWAQLPCQKQDHLRLG